MIKNIYTALCLWVISMTFAQNTLTGKVTNLEDNAPLPYVTIGIAGKGIGTVSDRNGNYKLHLTSAVNPDDEVTFSHIGYKTATHKVSFLQQTNSIALEFNTNVLDEVVLDIKKAKAKERKLGRRNIGLDALHFPFFINNEHVVVDDLLSKETGMHLKVKNDSWVTGLNFKISSNHFKKLRFRINFYTIEKGLPSELLFDNKNILFGIHDQYTGWLNVDLKEHDIYLEKDTEVAVTIQWLESEKAEENSKLFMMPISLVGGTQYVRDKAMDNWKKHKRALSFYLDVIEN